MKTRQYQLLHEVPWEELTPVNKVVAFNLALPTVPKDWRPPVKRTRSGRIWLSGLTNGPAKSRDMYYFQLLAKAEGTVFPFELVQPKPKPWNHHMIAKWGQPIDEPIIVDEVFDLKKTWRDIEIELELFGMFEENKAFLIHIASDNENEHQAEAIEYLREYLK